MMPAVTKRKRRAGLSLCFGPPPEAPEARIKEERSTSSSNSASPLSSSSTSSSSSSSSKEGSDLAVSGEGWRKEGRRKRNLARRILSRIVRSTAFVATLGKKACHKEKNSISAAAMEACGNSISDDGRKPKGPVLSSSSSSRSSSSSLLPPPTQPKSSCTNLLDQPPRNRGYVTSLGILLLVSLTIMLVWGKLCAILWTSTCFFIAPRKGLPFLASVKDVAGDESPVEVAAVEKGLAEVRWKGLEEEKKRVVLEGFLDRSQRNCESYQKRKI